MRAERDKRAAILNAKHTRNLNFTADGDKQATVLAREVTPIPNHPSASGSGSDRENRDSGP